MSVGGAATELLTHDDFFFLFFFHLMILTFIIDFLACFFGRLLLEKAIGVTINRRALRFDFVGFTAAHTTAVVESRVVWAMCRRSYPFLPDA